jgi:hypothetical protein
MSRETYDFRWETYEMSRETYEMSRATYEMSHTTYEMSRTTYDISLESPPHQFMKKIRLLTVFRAGIENYIGKPFLYIIY